MKSGEADAAAERQLAAETEWLVKAARTEWVARTDGAGFDPVPALVRAELETRMKEILRHPELGPLLGIIEQHNSQPRELPGRRLPQKDNFLLGPHLFQVLVSVQSRNEVHQRLPVLDQPAAEVRNHLQKVATDCKALAALILKGPQPGIALAGSIGRNEFLRVFAAWAEVFEATDGLKYQEVMFADLLKRGADWFDGLAKHVPRAPQNRHTGNDALRARAAEFLPGVFRKRLGHPYHAHVATIATVISGLATDEDFVKKVDRRRSKTEPLEGTKSAGKSSKPSRVLTPNL